MAEVAPFKDTEPDEFEAFPITCGYRQDHATVHAHGRQTVRGNLHDPVLDAERGIPMPPRALDRDIAHGTSQRPAPAEVNGAELGQAYLPDVAAQPAYLATLGKAERRLPASFTPPARVPDAALATGCVKIAQRLLESVGRGFSQP